VPYLVRPHEKVIVEAHSVLNSATNTPTSKSSASGMKQLQSGILNVHAAEMVAVAASQQAVVSALVRENPK